MQELVIGGRDLTGLVMEELRRGQQAKLFLAERVQRRAAAAGGERRILEQGEVDIQVHPTFYHYWGQRLGYECWSDPEFVREFKRDNPEVRVRSMPRTTTIVSNWAPDPTKSRFHRVYA